MVFIKALLTSLVLAVPLVLGRYLLHLVNIDVLTISAGASTAQRVPEACQFLLPIVQDIQDNLFTNECGDSVCPNFLVMYIALT